MKKCCVLKWGFLFALTVATPIALANVAPVETIPTQDMQQMPDANAQVTNVQNTNTNPPQSNETQSIASNSQPQDNSASDVADSEVSGDADGVRVARLEQQMSNMTQMNLPQQIAELRQEIQQLNGQLQVQQHDIKMLSNQQRSFYQDLNRRVQQLIGSGNVSLSAKNPASGEKVNTAAMDAGMTDSNAYRAAFNLLVKKHYPEAVERFKAYIDNYPNGAFISNAYYWLGEIYLKEGDRISAQQSFNKVVTTYPKSNKVPDAKLKLATIKINLGKKAEGRRQLQAIKREYPGSTAAQLASIQLQRMQ